MAANMTDVMDQLGVALGTITGLRVFDFPPKSAQPPWALVRMPESIDYDLTMGRGSDRMTIEVVVGVADGVDRVVRDAIAAYAAGSGSSSVKAAIEAATVGSSARVTKVEFDGWTLGGVIYPAAIFTVDIAA